MTHSSPDIQSVRLVDFRSFEHYTLPLISGCTTIVGPNGAGKTNVLEACAFSLNGSSPRTHDQRAVIRTGSTVAACAARFVDGHELRVAIPQHGRKDYALDGTAITTNVFRETSPRCVTFLPEHTLNFRGAPLRRRALVDRLVETLVADGARIIAAHESALRQRNTVLRNAKAGRAWDQQELSVWTTTLAEASENLRSARTTAVDIFLPVFTNYVNQLTEFTDINIVCEIRDDINDDQLTQNEIRRGTSMRGAQRDDISVFVDDRDMRTFGSTGEQRITALAWTFAHAEALAYKTGRWPFVALDEPFAELDAERAQRLAHAIDTIPQALVTTPEQYTAFTPAATVALPVTAAKVQT